MAVLLDRSGTKEGLANLLSEAVDAHGSRGVLLFACDANGFTSDEVDPLLRRVPVPLFGGAFPLVIYGSELLEHGTAAVCLDCEPRVQIVPGLSSAYTDFDEALDRKEIVGLDGRTMLVLVDGMGRRVNSLLTSLHAAFGVELSYLGGGAGSLSLRQKPCLLTNEGLQQDCAVLAVLPKDCGIGARHGMTSVSGPHKITLARPNAICELDWRPASDRFREIVAGLSARPLHEPSTFPVSDEFCLALNRVGDERIVCDPTAVEADGTLLVTPEVGEGEFVDVVRATPESEIASARKAFRLAQDSYWGAAPPGAAVCFCCSGRWRLMGERIRDEIAVVQEGGGRVVGVMTIGGEIANSGRDFLEYYNRTFAIGLLEQ